MNFSYNYCLNAEWVVLFVFFFLPSFFENFLHLIFVRFLILFAISFHVFLPSFSLCKGFRAKRSNSNHKTPKLIQSWKLRSHDLQPDKKKKNNNNIAARYFITLFNCVFFYSLTLAKPLILINMHSRIWDSVISFTHGHINAAYIYYYICSICASVCFSSDWSLFVGEWAQKVMRFVNQMPSMRSKVIIILIQIWF